MRRFFVCTMSVIVAMTAWLFAGCGMPPAQHSDMELQKKRLVLEKPDGPVLQPSATMFVGQQPQLDLSVRHDVKPSVMARVSANRPTKVLPSDLRARVKFVHASQWSLDQSILIDGEEVVSSLDPTKATSMIAVAPGKHKIEVKNKLSGLTLATKTYELAPKTRYTIFFHDNYGRRSLFLTTEPQKYNMFVGNALVRLVNVASDIPAVEMSQLFGDNVFPKVRYKAATSFTQVQSGTKAYGFKQVEWYYPLILLPEPPAMPKLEWTQVFKLSPGHAYSIVVVGKPKSTDPVGAGPAMLLIDHTPDARSKIPDRVIRRADRNVLTQ